MKLIESVGITFLLIFGFAFIVLVFIVHLNRTDHKEESHD